MFVEHCSNISDAVQFDSLMAAGPCSETVLSLELFTVLILPTRCHQKM